MKIHSFIFAIATTGVATSALAEAPAIKYDRFKNKTNLSVHTSDQHNTGGDLVFENTFIDASIQEHKLIELQLSYSYMSSHWKFLQCHDIAFLVDGKPWEPASTKFTNFMQQSATIEVWFVAITREQLAQLAGAQKIEFRVCNDEKTFDAQVMKNLQDFGPVLDEQLKGDAQASDEKKGT